MPDKNHPLNNLEGVVCTWEGSSILRCLVGCVPSCIPTIQWLDSIKLLRGICLFLPSCPGRCIDSFQFTLMLFCSLPLVELSRISTKPCCLAIGGDLLTENAISLISLLQDFLDDCNSPIIQIIPMIRLSWDLSPPWSAFVNFSPTFAENQKIGIYWNVLHVWGNPEMFTISS